MEPTTTTTAPETASEGVETADNNEPIVESADEENPVQEDGKVTEQEEPVEEEYDLKINGREIKANREQVIAMAQKAAAAQEMFQEAADTKKQVANLLEKLQSNPFEVLGKMGVSVKDIAEDYLYKIYQREEMPEDQRRVVEKEETMTAKERELAEREAAFEEQRTSMLTAQYLKQYDTEVSSALKASDLIVSPESVSRVANYMLMALNNGTDLSAEDAVKLVERDYASERKKISSDPDKLIKYLGEDGLKAAYEAYMGKKRPTNRAVNDGGYQQARKPAKLMSWADLKREIGELTDD